MQPELFHRADAHERRRPNLLPLLELFGTDTPVGPHLIDIVGVGRQVRKLIVDLMVDAAEPTLRHDHLDMRYRGDPLLVGHRNRVGEPGLVMRRDAGRGSGIAEYLISNRRDTDQRREDKQRDRDRKDGEKSPPLAAQEILENQRHILHRATSGEITLLNVKPRWFHASSAGVTPAPRVTNLPTFSRMRCRLGGRSAFPWLNSGEYALVEAIN